MLGHSERPRTRVVQEGWHQVAEPRRVWAPARLLFADGVPHLGHVALVLTVVLIASACTTASAERPEPSASPEATEATEAPVQRSASWTPQRSERVPDRIDATGGSNVSGALQRFIDGVPDGTEIVFPRGAKYRLGKGLVLDGRRRIALSGNGATLTGRGCGIEDSLIVIGRFEPAKSIVVRDLTLVGSNSNGGTSTAHRADCEYQMGVAIYRSTDVEIDNVTVRKVHGDCVYVGGDGSPFQWSSDIWYHDSVCDRSGRMGVAVVAGERVRVERNEVSGIGISAFDIEPNYAAGGARDIVFTDNTVGSFGVDSDWNPWFFEANGSGDATVRNITVSDNTLTAHPLRIKAQKPNRYNLVITGNRSTVEATGPVMFFEQVAGLEVTGNDQPLRRGKLASIKDSTDVVVD